MMRPILVAPLALAIATSAFAADCAGCNAKKMCKEHEDADKAAIDAAQPKFKNPDLLVRREGLELLGTAADKHANARSKKMSNEFVRMMADPEHAVKVVAAELLGKYGDEGMAVATLGKEAQKVEGLIPGIRPPGDKEKDLKEFERNVDLLETLYKALAATNSPAAVTHVERGLKSTSSYWVVKVAADCSKGFPKSKLIMKALVSQLASIHGKNSSPATDKAWQSISLALPEVSGCNDIEKQKDGVDATRWLNAWQRWMKENEKTLK